MKMNKIINIQAEVNPHFKTVWKTKEPYNILKGGRNSFKSSVIALLLVYMMIPYLNTNKKANVVVIRKVANTIRDSVFLKMQWSLNKFGIAYQFNMTVSPFKITHKKTGSTIYFYGQDDFEKLKSNDIGNIIAVWYEEASEFKNAEEFDQSNTTFMRQKHPSAECVRFFWSYNPPRNPYSWINEWAESLKGEEGYLVHESSYLNDELNFVDDQMLNEINRIKKNDYDYYRYLYLGEPVGLGTNIYNFDLFNVIHELPDNDKLKYLYFSIDAGHQVSATSCGAYALTSKGNVIKLDTFYYSPSGRVHKKAPSELTKELYEFMNSISKKYKIEVMNITIDSAEGGLRNQFDLDYGISLHPVAKKKKVVMIDYTHDLLAQGRFFVLKNSNRAHGEYSGSNDIFLDECKRYQWDEKTIKSDDPKVVKDDDHSVDEFQYFCTDNLSDLGLDI